MGKEQAHLLGKRLYNTLFDFVYCSDLNRTRQTCDNILFHQPQDTDMSVFYCKELWEIKVDGVEGQSWDVEQKIRQDPKTTFRMSKTGEKDESWADVFLRVSKFFDGLIQKFVDAKYLSGVSESNYIEINSKKDEEYLTAKEVKEMFDKGELTNKNVKENGGDKKVLIVAHGGILAEMVNNVLYRLGKKIALEVESHNCTLYRIRVHKKENEEGKVDISVELFDDYSHLN